MQEELSEIKALVEDYQRGKEQSNVQLSEARTELSRVKKQRHDLEKQRHDLVAAYKQLEGSQKQMVESYKQRDSELTQALEQTEKKLKSGMTTAHAQVESLEHERDALQQRVEEMEAGTSRMRREHEAQRTEMLAAIDRMKQAPARVTTPTQTDTAESGGQAVHEIRAYYVDIIAKMRG